MQNSKKLKKGDTAKGKKKKTPVADNKEMDIYMSYKEIKNSICKEAQWAVRKHR